MIIEKNGANRSNLKYYSGLFIHQYFTATCAISLAVAESKAIKSPAPSIKIPDLI